MNEQLMKQVEEEFAAILDEYMVEWEASLEKTMVESGEKSFKMADEIDKEHPETSTDGPPIVKQSPLRNQEVEKR